LINTQVERTDRGGRAMGKRSEFSSDRPLSSLQFFCSATKTKGNMPKAKSAKKKTTKKSPVTSKKTAKR
jgi:hypothetical protein